MTDLADPTSFDRFAAEYDRFVSLLPGQNSAWVTGLGVKGERAIDVGCGSGHAAERLADDFGQVLGVDLSEPMIAIARERRSRPNLEYRVADLFEVDDEGFDLVYSHTMLHRVRGFPAEIRRVGLRDAWFELRFWHSKPWLEHLLSDRYLSRAQFREIYGTVFPGAEYDDLGFALAMRWKDERGG
ncbi:class I SAM-dependent methyltransferase [Kribbella qitaiheensis]|uniref:class I SAM-dependent methyltransferase n=1 Tax=Kribbella qitaiheensis TaxID=1544730 RepID=UPI00361ACDC9